MIEDTYSVFFRTMHEVTSGQSHGRTQEKAKSVTQHQRI